MVVIAIGYLLSTITTANFSSNKEKRMKQCAILTMDCLDEFEVYDELLRQPLLDLGWQMTMVSWRDKQVNWADFQAVIIRSPWDYQDDAQAFIEVLKQIEQSPAQLENNFATVCWNIDKIYLKELANNGVNIVPTLWAEQFNVNQLSASFTSLDSEQIVIKPRISANADNTFWLKQASYQQQLPQLAKVFAKGDFMMQPFMENIISEGEYSLFYFNGKYSHAILKTPQTNDFRVQEEHGGSLKAIVPEEELLNCADNTMATLAEINGMPLYARVDFVRYQHSYALMEAELIEPSLYFNMDDQSPQRFAQAFVKKMATLT
jgi:hypothetical protein